MSKKWDARYIDLAQKVSTWSKDPSTQCGAVLIGDSGQVLTQGYNGFPRDMNDDPKLYNDRNTKYARIVHAEMNAIYNASRSGVSLKDSTAYVHGLPCCGECAKALIQVGVKRVVMIKAKNSRWNDSCNDAIDFFKEANIEITYI